MNIAYTVEQLSAQQQQTQPWAPAQTSVPAQPSPIHRRDPGSTASVVVALCFLSLFVGAIVFTSYAEQAQKKNKVSTPARNMPMIHLR